MAEEKQMTEEEYKKLVEERQKEVDDFLLGLEKDPEGLLTKGDFLKMVNFLFEDLGGVARMASMNTQNIQGLGMNFNQLVGAIQGGPQAPVGKKTKGGLIIP
jgi:hypothetical protein